MRILIIEDEHRIATSLKKGFEQEHFAVDVRFDGTEGYDMAASEEYDVIILDRMLPGMDGMTICTELRKNSIHTPILLLTAKGQIGDKVDGLESGADDYMTKPFSFEELLARVRALTRRPKQTTTKIVTVEELQVNTVTFDVNRAGKSIALSSKEYALLEYLMQHQNTIVSKEQIIAHVWPYDADILPNTVEVYIRKLREKIDIPFTNSKKLIQTVRGFGYKLGA